jgi:glycosyltransferase involved in cell wall biosynthesis
LPLISSPKIGRAIKRINLDIIHSHHFFLSGQIAWYYTKKLKLPLVFTYHTRYDLFVHYAPLPEELSKPLTKTLSTLYANSCDAVIAPGKSIKDLILEYGVRKPAYIIPSGIDIDKFKKTGDEEKIREKYNIKNDAILLLTVCRLSEEKNLTFLLKVFQKITKKRKNVYFMIVGDGPEKENLEKQSFKLGLKEKIIFTDKISYQRIPSFYNAGDIFLFSSFSEVQPTIFTEAMASGLPIVAIKAIGSEDVITNGENGFLAFNDVDDFSQKTLKIIDNENLRKKMSEKAKNRAKYFSIENSTKKMVSLYEKVIGQKKEENKLKQNSILFQDIFKQK